MRAPSFWWRDAGLAAGLLSPFAALYGAVAGGRLAHRGERAGRPVICVGNPTLGGAGKTPTAIALARLLLAEGAKPFFLTRGYGGRLSGPVRVGPDHNAADVGDEPLLLAHVAPTIVSVDRVAGARLAVESGASAIVMDDGFQNPSLAKDLSILVVDAERGVGNGRVFPAGPLRAPLAPQLARAQALLVVGAGTGAAAVIAQAQARAIPVFHGELTPDAATVAKLKGKRVLAFAGIGNPEKFFASLAGAGVTVAVKHAYGDHYPYSHHDASALLDAAERDGLVLVTTEKDRERLHGDPALTALAARSQALPVRMEIREDKAWRAFIRSALSPAAR